MSYPDFFLSCATFDWHFTNGSYSRWLAGTGAKAVLEAQADADPIKRQIMDAWEAWAYSGPVFGTDPAPMPRLADFIPPTSTFPGDVPTVHPDQMELFS